PALLGFVKARLGDAGIEDDVAAEIEAIGNVVGIGEDFGLRRIFLRPVPLLIQFLREGEGVLHALDVAARARIAIPVPGTADAAAGFKYPCLQAQSAQPVQHVHAGKSGADHDSVIAGSNFGRALRLGRGPGMSSGIHDFWFLRAFPLAAEYDAIRAEIDDEMLRAPMPQRDRRLPPRPQCNKTTLA